MKQQSRIALAAFAAASLLAVACGSNAQSGLDTTAEGALEAATAAAQTQYSTNLSFSGFDAARAKFVDPKITWTDDGSATTGQISIRDISADGLVLVTKAEAGDTLCISVQTSGITKGTQDAQTAADCAGGWPA